MFPNIDSKQRYESFRKMCIKADIEKVNPICSNKTNDNLEYYGFKFNMKTKRTRWYILNPCIFEDQSKRYLQKTYRFIKKRERITWCKEHPACPNQKHPVLLILIGIGTFLLHQEK